MNRNVNLHKPDAIANIDDNVFRAHYKVTTTILFICFMLFTVNYLYISHPKFRMNDGAISKNAINTSCWTTRTFTSANQTIENDTYLNHLGVSSYVYNEAEMYYQSYRWILFMFLIQIAMFYMPHLCWVFWENNTISLITTGLRKRYHINTADRVHRQKILVTYLCASLNSHSMYALGYFWCEIMNLFNVIINMFIIEQFLGGECLMNGIKVVKLIQMDEEHQFNPMATIFIKVTKSIFQNYSSLESVETYDTFCIIPHSALDKIIYLLLQVWFIVLIFITGLALEVNLLLATMPPLRKMILARGFTIGSPQWASEFINKTNMGDFFMLQQLYKNLDDKQFLDVLREFSIRLNLSNLLNDPSTDKQSELYIV